MKRFWIWKGIKFGLLGLAAVTLFAFVVMSLWNWLLPSIAGVTVITFWQALGLIILAKLLFGGFRRRHFGGWGWRHRMHIKWKGMSDEEREKFRYGMHSCCGWRSHREETVQAEEVK